MFRYLLSSYPRVTRKLNVIDYTCRCYISYIKSVIKLPITEQCKQQEWKIILLIVKNNGFPLQMIRHLRNKILHKTHKT